MSDEKKKVLSDEEIWDKAGSGQPITHDDLGLKKDNRKDGTVVLTEGFDFSSVFLKEEKNDK